MKLLFRCSSTTCDVFQTGLVVLLGEVGGGVGEGGSNRWLLLSSTTRLNYKTVEKTTQRFAD